MSIPDQQQTETPVCYRHPKRETWISCQRCGRHICPDCQTPAAVGVHCPECVKEGQAGMPRRAPGWVRAFAPGRATVVTYVLIALNVVVYILQWATAQQITEAWFLNPYVAGSEPWRLITSAFLHAPNFIPHLLFNMYALFIFGPVLESFLGRIRFIALYLIGALGGSMGVLTTVEVWAFADGSLQNAPAGALGASGAVFALMGAVFAMRKAMGVDVRQLLIVLAINLAIPFFVGGIAWQGHVGGFVIGFLLGLIFVRTRRPGARTAQILGIAGVAAGLLLLFAGYLISAPQLYF
jgi:membrane associated rhomboid family serine protease